MKIIHCADLHLDSKLNSNLSKEKSRERRIELLNTYNEMIKYAKDNAVNAILISGDMFDTRTVSATTRNIVQDSIISNPEIDFFYIRGNHDIESFLSNLDEIPPNLKLFDEKWISYELSDDIHVTGIELTDSNYNLIYDSLNLKADKFNIVMIHGQEAASQSQSTKDIISIKDLKNKHIDYLALGHIHSFKKEILDSRGIYCYPGCLEGRGFDEIGRHGFVLMDIDEEERKFSIDFVPIAKRELWLEKVDISEIKDTADAIDKMENQLIQLSIPKEDLVKIELIGYIDVETEINFKLIEKKFENTFYYFSVKDETKIKVDMNQFALDQSLKGEFVRLVMRNQSLSEEEKATIVRYGIQALAGEEIV